jgi:hypothetical protein
MLNLYNITLMVMLLMVTVPVSLIVSIICFQLFNRPLSTMQTYFSPTQQQLPLEVLVLLLQQQQQLLLVQLPLLVLLVQQLLSKMIHIYFHYIIFVVFRSCAQSYQCADVSDNIQYVECVDGFCQCK